MALAGNNIRIILTPLDPANWTLISAPTDTVVGTVTARHALEDSSGNPLNPVDIYIRSDSADPTTQDTIPANFERTFRFSSPWPRTGLFYAKPASGTGPLVCVCNP
jgi:hypothetical protein